MIKNIFRISTGLASIAVILLSSCDSSRHKGFEETEAGLFYQFHRQDESAKAPQLKDILYTHLTISLLGKGEGVKNSVLYDSKIRPNFPGGIKLIPLSEPEFKGDFMEGLKMMHIGDSASFVVSADSFFLITNKLDKLPEGGLQIIGGGFYPKISSDSSPNQKLNDDDEIAGIYSGIDNVGMESSIILSKDGSLIIKSSVGDGKPDYGTWTGTADNLSLFHKDIMGKNELIGNAKIDPSINSGDEILITVGLVDIQSEQETMKRIEALRSQSNTEEKAMMDQMQAEEPAATLEYLKRKNIIAKPTASGLYFIETAKGNGAKAKLGQKVTMQYTGYLLNGKKFDSSFDNGKPFTFTLGKAEVIAGWDEGVAMMNVGSSATFVIPSSLAYGSNGQGPIPPFSPLVFEVQLMKAE